MKTKYPLVVRAFEFVKSKIQEKFAVKRWHVLAKLINDYNLKYYIEVGVYKGKTLDYLKKHTKARLVGFDPYKTYPGSEFNQKWFNELKRRVSKRHKILFYDSITASKTIENNSIDIIFIDADHRYKAVYQDIKAWLPKVKKGGFLCGDDFCNQHYGVIKAVDELLDINKIKVVHDNVWIYRKEK
jgi:predicted O-methyltransferase YrrM